MNDKSKTVIDAELAYHLQNREYEEHQLRNEYERKLVASDIRIAKKVQSREETRAKKQGILLGQFYYNYEYF